ncbi:MAG: hypothetical protein F6K30_11015 [Cyanothece sp. SIO2G6]|nr:hypothetical protein [Cyanothece sp. SIO2G6]
MTTSTSGVTRLSNFVQSDLQSAEVQDAEVQDADLQDADLQVQPNVQSNVQGNDGAEILRVIAIGSPPIVDQHIKHLGRRYEHGRGGARNA